MYGGNIESDFVLQNCRCWQDIYNCFRTPQNL